MIATEDLKLPWRLLQTKDHNLHIMDRNGAVVCSMAKHADSTHDLWIEKAKTIIEQVNQLKALEWTGKA